MALKWPKEVWPLLLQCRLSGRAQEVVASLSLDDSLSYDTVKATVLRTGSASENHKKVQTRTYVEFARDKQKLFDKWCAASKAHTLAEVRELLLLEDFKNHLPDRIVVHLNEKKVEFLSQAAVLADEYALTHKTVFSEAPASREEKPTTPTRGSSPLPEAGQRPEQRECYYCHKVGHMIADCPTLKSKPKSPQRQSKEVGLVQSVARSCKPTSVPIRVIHPLFRRVGCL